MSSPTPRTRDQPSECDGSRRARDQFGDDRLTVESKTPLTTPQMATPTQNHSTLWENASTDMARGDWYDEQGERAARRS